MACISKRRGRWVLDFYDQHGKRQRLSLPDGTNKAQAREELRAIEEMVARGTFLPIKKSPPFEEVARDWLEHKRLKLRVTTWEVYEGHVRNHFQDLKGRRINQVTVAQVEKFITARQAEGMNLGTLRKILVTLGQILGYAVRHKYLDHNPLRDAERPRGQGQEGEGNDKIAILTPKQLTTFLEAVSDKKYRTLFMLAIMTGARQGELLGLKWSDIDWEGKQIVIQRTFNKGRFFTPKTRGSIRRIDLAPSVVKGLKEWRLACPKNELDLVFPSKGKEPINYSNMVRRHFQPALAKVRLPRIRFHDLRHTYASLLIHQGENIKYIQSQLGHANPTITLNIYAHLMKPTNQEAACRLENSVFG
jgi:integrase